MMRNKLPTSLCLTASLEKSENLKISLYLYYIYSYAYLSMIAQNCTWNTYECLFMTFISFQRTSDFSTFALPEVSSIFFLLKFLFGSFASPSPGVHRKRVSHSKAHLSKIHLWCEILLKCFGLIKMNGLCVRKLQYKTPLQIKKKLSLCQTFFLMWPNL